MEFLEGCSSVLPPAPQCIVRMKRYFFGFSFVSSSSSWVKRGLPGLKWLVESAQRWLFMLHSDQNFPDTPELPGNRTGIRPANRREKQLQCLKQQFRIPARLPGSRGSRQEPGQTLILQELRTTGKGNLFPEVVQPHSDPCRQRGLRLEAGEVRDL